MLHQACASGDRQRTFKVAWNWKLLSKNEKQLRKKGPSAAAKVSQSKVASEVKSSSVTVCAQMLDCMRKRKKKNTHKAQVACCVLRPCTESPPDAYLGVRASAWEHVSDVQ